MNELKFLRGEIQRLKMKIRYLESEYADEDEINYHLELLDELICKLEENENGQKTYH